MKYEVTVENDAEMRLTEEGPYLPCSYCGSTFHQPPCPYEPVAPQWMGTEPCYAAETNAHISAFFARNFRIFASPVDTAKGGSKSGGYSSASLK